MSTAVKTATLYRAEIGNIPGTLAETLKPLATAGADLQVVMAYRIPGDRTKAAVEVYPVQGKKSLAAAQATGLKAMDTPMLIVTGDNKPGLGARIADGMAAAGINMSYLVAQVSGRKYSAVFGFENVADARKAAGVIKRASAPAKKAAKKR